MEDDLNILLLRFKQTKEYTQEMLIRDLIELAQVLIVKLKDLEQRVEALEP